MTREVISFINGINKMNEALQEAQVNFKSASVGMSDFASKAEEITRRFTMVNDMDALETLVHELIHTERIHPGLTIHEVVEIIEEEYNENLSKI